MGNNKNQNERKLSKQGKILIGLGSREYELVVIK